MRMQRHKWSASNLAAGHAALQRPAVRENPGLGRRVSEIISLVRSQGDTALLDFARELDGVQLTSLRVSADEAQAAAAELPEEAIAAISNAIANVRRFHEQQIALPIRVETAPGVVCERISRPIGAVGLYVPAGTAPLPSTAIMLGVPSAIAGCPVRVLCTPPRPDGRADPAVVVAAQACGVSDIFKVGGAQAIAAMGYGTATVPKVAKIFGPGNAWVTAAKAAVAADPAGAAFDMPAGPSEVMVIADDRADPRFIALDLLSQAEHGPDSHVVLVAMTEKMIIAVEAEMELELAALPRRAVIEAALRQSVAVLADSIDEAISVANEYAPEHLILGRWTPESVGDYCSGTNHVLPTYGYARAFSGLSVADFQRQITLQEVSLPGLRGLAPTVRVLAGLEGLDAHARAVAIRLSAADTPP
jgi:histidinol dehydrogenase